MLKPLADRVLVEVDVEESKTAGGILLPDTAQKKSQKGTVIAIGSGKVLDNGERLPFEVAVGDRVLLQSIPVLILKKAERSSFFFLKEIFLENFNIVCINV